MPEIFDELKLDFAGLDVERTVGQMSFRMDYLPDFGVFATSRDTQDAGELGQITIGVVRPQPRNVAFLIHGEVDLAVTDRVERYRRLMAGWGELRAQFTPALGVQELGVTFNDLHGSPVRRRLLAECLEEPSFRLVSEGGRENLGGRPAGTLKWLARFVARWPYFIGAEQAVPFNTALGNTYTISNPGDAVTGWQLLVTTVNGTPPAEIAVEFNGGGVVNIRPRQTPWVPGSAIFRFDWFHSNPQSWLSTKEVSGAIESYGDLQTGEGSNAGRILRDVSVVGSNTVTITPDTGSLVGVFYTQPLYRDIT